MYQATEGDMGPDPQHGGPGRAMRLGQLGKKQLESGVEDIALPCQGWQYRRKSEGARVSPEKRLTSGETELILK